MDMLSNMIFLMMIMLLAMGILIILGFLINGKLKSIYSELVKFENQDKNGEVSND
jgi:hypothetical protein